MAVSVQNFVKFQQSQLKSADKSAEPEIMSLKNGRRLSVAYQNQTTVGKPPDTEVNDGEALSDLQDILSMTAVFTPPRSNSIHGASSASPRASRRNSSHLSYNFFASSAQDEAVMHANPLQTGLPSLDEPDEWRDVDVTSSATESDASVLLQGYLRMKKTPIAKYVKQYFVLNKSHQLIYYSDKSDVTGHVARAKGIIHSSEVKSILNSDVDMTVLEVVCKNKTYFIQAYTQLEAAEWYTALCGGMITSGDMSSIYMEAGASSMGDEVMDIANFNPMVGGMKKKQAIRRASMATIQPKSPPAAATITPRVTTETAIDGIPQEKKGYLKKDNLWVWQERWFELSTPGVLSWYKQVSESGVGLDTGAKGHLSLQDVISVDQSEDDPCFFNIDVKGRTHKLQADSDGLAAEWCALLITWMEYLPFAEITKVRCQTSPPSYNGSGLEMIAQENKNTPRSRGNGRRSSLLVSQLKDTDVVQTPKKEVAEAQGWVKKKIETGAWEREWLWILKPGILLWFTSDEEATQGQQNAKGVLQIASILSVDLLPRDKRNFEVNIKGKTFKFQCYSEEETKYWYDALLDWMEACSKNLTQTPPSRRKSVRASILHLQKATSGVNPPETKTNTTTTLLKEKTTKTQTPLIITKIQEEDENESDENDDTHLDKNNQSAVNAFANLPVKSEMISMKADNSDKWQTQFWLELQAPGQVAFYAKQADSTRGLSRARGVIPTTDILAAEVHPLRPSFFDIDVKGKTYFFEAQSVSSAQEWCHAMQVWCKHSISTTSTPGHKQYHRYAEVLTTSTAPPVLDSVKPPEALRGMLKKEADVGRIWRKRWCEVTHPGYMRWYASENDAVTGGETTAKGFIVLTEVLSMNVGSIPGRTTFDINVKGRSFEFQAPSIAEAQTWFDNVCNWVNFASQNKQLFADVKAETVKENVINVKEDILKVNHLGATLPEKAGLIVKKLENSSKWQERWLVLTHPGKLAYYTQKSDSVRGLSRAIGVVLMTDVLSVEVHVSKPHCFDLTVQGREEWFEFQADSAEDAQTWCTVIQTWINYHIWSVFKPGRQLFHHNCVVFESAKKSQSVIEREQEPSPMQGTLKKRGGFGGRIWHQRWCEITSSGHLSWYAHEEDAVSQDLTCAEGYLALGDVIAMFMDPSPATKNFDVDVKGKNHKFQASGVEEAQAWFAKLSAWVAHAHFVQEGAPQTVLTRDSVDQKMSSSERTTQPSPSLLQEDIRQEQVEHSLQLPKEEVVETVSSLDKVESKVNTTDTTTDTHVLTEDVSQMDSIVLDVCETKESSSLVEEEGPVEQHTAHTLVLEESEVLETEAETEPQPQSETSKALELADKEKRKGLVAADPVTRLSALPEKSGVVMYRDAEHDDWPRRWLEIKQPGQLAYHCVNETDNGGESSPASCVLKMRDVISVEVNIDQPRFFDVDVSGCTHEFEAESVEIALEWYHVILAWVNHHLEIAATSGRKSFHRNSLLQRTSLLSLSTDTENANVVDGDEKSASSGQLVEKTGWLSERESTLDAWHRRWCVISRPGNLCWYVNEEDKQAVDFIALHEIIAINMDALAISFEVDAKGRCFEFKTSSTDEAREWFEAIQAWVEFACMNMTLFVSKELNPESGKEKSGMVQKKGDNKIWHERWLELKEPGKLAYYAKKTDSVRGCARANGVVLMSDVLSVEVHPNKPHCFDVNVQNLVYEFETDSSETAHEWYSAILMWMIELNTAKSSKTKPNRKLFQRSAVISGGDELAKRYIDEPMKARGFLKKKKVGGHGVWQQRWCEVTAPGHLSWYASKKDAQAAAQDITLAKGFISLNNVISMNMDSAKDTTSFDIDLKGRTYNFKSSTPEESQAWFEKIFNWVDYARVNSDLFIADTTTTDNNNNTDLTSANAFLPEMSGLVKKKGGNKKKGEVKWQERWLALTKTGQLAYYGRKSDSMKGLSRAKGFVQMTDVLSVEVKERQPCSFDVDVKGRTYCFETASPQLAQEWYNAILMWVTHMCNEENESKDSGGATEHPSASAAKQVEATPPPKKISRSGFLKKQGGIFGNKWQTRWFCLNDGILAWFETESQSLGGADKAKGHMFVSEILSVDHHRADDICLEINLKGRVLKLQADNCINASAWVDCLLKNVQYGNDEPVEESGGITARLETLVEENSENNDDQSVSSDGKSQQDHMDTDHADVATETEKQAADEEAARLLADKQAADEEVAARLLAEKQAAEKEAARLLAEKQAADEEAARLLAEKQAADEEAARLLADKQAADDEATRLLAEKQAADDEATGLLTEQEESCYEEDEANIESREHSLQSYYNKLDNDDDDFEDDDAAAEDKPPIDNHDVDMTFEDHNSIQKYKGTLDTDDKKLENEPSDGITSVNRCPHQDQTCVNNALDIEVDNVSTSPFSPMSSIGKLFASSYDPVSTMEEEEEKEEEEDNAAMHRKRVLSQTVTVPKAWSSSIEFETIGGIVDDDEDDYESDDESNSDYMDSSDEDSEQGEEGNEVDEDAQGEETETDHSRMASVGRGGRIKKRHNLDHNTVEQDGRRRGSMTESKNFMRTNSEVKKDDFLNKLKSSSAKDLNKEFWVNHRYYLTFVMCFVTLHVLYVTSFVLTGED